MSSWADEKSDIPARVIVLDVFQRVRSVKTSQGKNTYADDYTALAGLQRWANKRGICLVVLHHNRKATSDDAFDSVSGSTGMTGAVDMVLVLRGGRGEPEAGLYVAGRDVIEDRDYSLVREDGLWRIGEMPVELATASGRMKFSRYTWKQLHSRGIFGMTTEEVADIRKASLDTTRHHLALMEENGWVQALNAPAPGVPVRWAAVTRNSAGVAVYAPPLLAGGVHGDRPQESLRSNTSASSVVRANAVSGADDGLTLFSGNTLDSSNTGS